MKALLDTHTFLWWVTNDAQLSDAARDIIADGANHIYLSVASAWEIAIKVGTGKLQLPEPPSQYVTNRVAQNGFRVLPILLAHALHTAALPPHHRDPFDRILVAQSFVEEMPLLTADAQIAVYGVFVIW